MGIYRTNVGMDVNNSGVSPCFLFVTLNNVRSVETRDIKDGSQRLLTQFYKGRQCCNLTPLAAITRLAEYKIALNNCCSHSIWLHCLLHLPLLPSFNHFTSLCWLSKPHLNLNHSLLMKLYIHITFKFFYINTVPFYCIYNGTYQY